MSAGGRRVAPERAWLVYRAGFGLSLYLAVSTYTLLLIDQGLGPLELALLGTSLEIAYTLGEVPTGVVADRHGRRRSQGRRPKDSPSECETEDAASGVQSRRIRHMTCGRDH